MKRFKSLITPRELRVAINVSILNLNRWPSTGPVSEWPSRCFQNAHDLHLRPSEIRQAGDRGSLEDLSALPSQPTPLRSYTACKSNPAGAKARWGNWCWMPVASHSHPAYWQLSFCLQIFFFYTNDHRALLFPCFFSNYTKKRILKCRILEKKKKGLGEETKGYSFKGQS